MFSTLSTFNSTINVINKKNKFYYLCFSPMAKTIDFRSYSLVSSSLFISSLILIVKNDTDNIFVGLDGNNIVYYSNDFYNWSPSINVTNSIPMSSVSFINYNGNVWLATTLTNIGGNYMFRSTDGLNWNGCFSSSIYNPLLVESNGQYWLTSGANKPFYRSNDNGINWFQTTSQLYTAYSFCWSGTVWCANTQSSTAFSIYSYDGNTWITANTQCPQLSNRTGCASNKLGTVVFVVDNIIYTSIDNGNNYIKSYSFMTFPLYNQLSSSDHALTCVNGIFIVRSQDNGNNRPFIYSSDGLTWNNLPTNNNYNQVNFSPTVFFH
jgi:hypothetical protein